MQSPKLVPGVYPGAFYPVSDLPSNAAYSKRFDAVLAFIEANLEGDLCVKTLSRVANFSTFHFHRQFTAFVGVPVSRYVQLMRLRRAAHDLSSRADYSGAGRRRWGGLRKPRSVFQSIQAGVRYGAERLSRNDRIGTCGTRYSPSLIFPGALSCR